MILYVVRYWPALTETFVRDEVRALSADGLAIEVAAFDRRDRPEPGDPSFVGVRVHQQPHRWGWLAALPGLVMEWLRRPAWISPRALWLARLGRASSRMHVHFAGEAAEWTRTASARTGVPYSVTVHAVDLFRPRPLLRAVLRDAVQVMTISVYNADLLRQRIGVDVNVVRCGVQLPGLDPPAGGVAGGGAPCPKSPQGMLRVMTAGRDVPKKGFRALAHAMQRVPGVHLLAFTTADLPGDRRGLRPHAEVLAALREVDVFVLACEVAADGDSDGLPVVILEAMAAGVAVITTSVAGIPEVVDASVGWLVPPNDVEALVAAMHEARLNPEEVARRGARGPARLKQRGFDRVETTAQMHRLLTVVTPTPPR